MGGTLVKRFNPTEPVNDEINEINYSNNVLSNTSDCSIEVNEEIIEERDSLIRNKEVLTKDSMMIEVIEPVSEEENYIPEIVICAADREKIDNKDDDTDKEVNCGFINEGLTPVNDETLESVVVDTAENTNDEISVKTDPSTISINSQHHGNVNDGYEENEESVPDPTQDAVSVNIDVAADNLIEKSNEIVITSVFAAENTAFNIREVVDMQENVESGPSSIVSINKKPFYQKVFGLCTCSII